MFFGNDSRQAIDRLTVRVAELERSVAALSKQAGIATPERKC